MDMLPRSCTSMGKTWPSPLRCCWYAMLAISAVGFVISSSAYASGSTQRLIATLTDPSEQGDGTMSNAVAKAMLAPLPSSYDSIVKKRAANSAFDAARQRGRLARPESKGLSALLGDNLPQVPVIVGGRSFQGQFDRNTIPSDSTGAIGPTRFVQLVNRRFGIYDRTSNAPLSSGTLQTLANVASSVNTFDPQIIWDATTRRFYYVMDGTFSSTDNRLLVGWSKTDSPTTQNDWCRYSLNFGAEFYDYPKLGDTQNFAVVGANIYNSSDLFVRADAVTFSKPAAGTNCPSTFSFFVRKDLRDNSNLRVFSPTPANQIDGATTGYIIARSVSLNTNRLWLFGVTQSGGSATIDANGKQLTLPINLTVPPDADQPGATQKLDTSDTRLQQAVMAFDPLFGISTVWTALTIGLNNHAAVVYLEINPIGTPALARGGTIAPSGVHVFNAAISPDRQVDGSTARFGDSFVLGFSASSAAANIPASIAMASSAHGGPVGIGVVTVGVGPYLDFGCTAASSLCRWGDYSGATPDPHPSTSGAGAVWLTNQFSGFAPPSPTAANWRTWIWAAQP